MGKYLEMTADIKFDFLALLGKVIEQGQAEEEKDEESQEEK